MALEPITRKEKIIAGQDLTPITRMEKFLKQYGGGGGGVFVPKPLTYDYMPDGYPKKTIGTVTVMEEQEVAFTLSEADGFYMAPITNAFEIVEGKTYTVNWDGTEYECVGIVNKSQSALGNLSIAGEISDTGEPFIYVYDTKQHVGMFFAIDTSASHTISVTGVEETVTPMAEEFLPANTKNTTVFYI